ncbi:calcium-binding protein [Inquilinus sp. NPDC058860]|uniref:calcium-binding protein n=1 Tax=Inquilinus sp. NPDC058860 TaxID=3346652 RepID=UPI0036853A99
MSGYWSLNVEIDRSSGTFNAWIDYFVDPYIDPETSEYFGDTSWAANYTEVGGSVIGWWGNYGAESGTALVDPGLAAGPGLKTYVLGFTAANTFSGESISASWTVFSVAYDTTPQAVFGTATDDIIIGGDASDVLRGFNGADLIDAGDGDDILDGGSGGDRLDGGAGDDIAIGGAGDDLVTVDSTGDIVVERAGEGHDRVLALASVTLAANVEELTLGGSLGLNGTGNAADNRIFGNDGANTLTGLGGDDILFGSNGDDVLRGGLGADQLSGGWAGTNAGTDTVTYTEGSAGVTVNLVTGVGSGGAAQGDRYVEIDNVDGSQGNDSLVGNTYANVLRGWNGNDVLTGAGGKDMLTGGAGADRFVYSSTAQSMVGSNADRITDFSHAQGDRIDLAAIDASTAAAGNQAFTFIGTGLYTGVAGQLRYVVNGGVTTIGGDVNGDKVTDFHIQLTGSITLMAGDFIL